jgi:hypothetical protein
MTIQKIEPPIQEANQAKAEAEVILSISQMFTVTNHEEFVGANAELQSIKKKSKEIEAKRQELKAPILEAGRKVDDLFKPALAVLAAAEEAIKKQMIAYQREQERIRKEAEDKARIELERAERARMKAIEKGDVTKVAKLEERVASIAATVADSPPLTKVRGFSITEIWNAQVVDFMALVKAVAAGKQPIELLLPNEKALDDLAKAHTTNLSIPGVLAVKRDSAASRAR